MTEQKRAASRPRGGTSRAAQADDDAWLVRAAEQASQDAGGVSSEFLGDYLPMLADAATSGRLPAQAQIDAVRLQGRRASEQGVSAG